MSMPKAGQSTQVSKVELPPWVDQASQQNYAMARQVAGKRNFSNYDPSKRFVGPGADTQAADAYYRNNMTAADPMYEEALKGRSNEIRRRPFLSAADRRSGGRRPS